MDFLILFLAAFGMCFGLMNGKVKFLTNYLVKIPFFAAMLVCPYCTGFHTGYIAWLLLRLPQYAFSVYSPERVVTAIAEVVATAFASSALCYLFDTAAQWAEDTAAATRNDAE